MRWQAGKTGVSESGIQQGMFVRDNRPKAAKHQVGKVEKLDSDNAVVEFWVSGKNKPSISQQFLEPLPQDAPEVMLWERPSELASLAKKAPLKLLATVLSLNGSINGKTSKEADIREKLHGRVALGQWEDWWQKSTSSMVNSPDHFRIRKDKGVATYTLLTKVEDVPEGLPKKKTASARKTSRKQRRPRDSELLKLLTEGTKQNKMSPRLLKASRDVAAAVFKASDSDSYYCGLDRLLDLLPSDERVQVIREIIVTSSGGKLGKGKVSEYVATSRHVVGPERLPLLVMAGLLLTTDQHREVVTMASRELADAFIVPDEYDLVVRNLLYDICDRHTGKLNELGQAHAKELRQEQYTHAVELKELHQSHAAELEQERQAHANELKNLHQSHIAELEKLRQSHDVELEKLRIHVAELEREQNRLHQRIETLDAQMASGREESRLEIRQGMLLAVGDALQRAYLQGKSPEDRLSNVITTLPKALQEGEAETFGTVGAIAKYDPKLHHSPERISSGAKVRLTAPGVVVGERVILKASVSSETEVC